MSIFLAQAADSWWGKSYILEKNPKINLWSPLPRGLSLLPRNHLVSLVSLSTIFMIAVSTFFVLLEPLSKP